jgi:hypothetical protein
MSESEPETGSIRDEDLPEDLQPSEENPLAEPLDEDVDRDDLDVQGGKTPEESDDDEDGGSGNESDDDGSDDDGSDDD